MLSLSLFKRFRGQLRTAVLLLFLSRPLAAVQARQNVPLNNTNSTFSARLMNIEAASNETFRYTATLYNRSAKSKVYELKAALPQGWQISYKVEGSQISSLYLVGGKSQDIAIEVNASAVAAAGKYAISIKAESPADTLTLKLEAVVRGSYAVSIGTPSGRLSEELGSGSHKDISLEVQNTGSLPLSDVSLTGQLPTGWEVTFEPAKITKLEAGKRLTIKASVKVPDKTIAGDYAATISVNSANANAQAAFRLFVKTSLLSGWIGILVILAAILLLYFLIRKYGRR